MNAEAKLVMLELQGFVTMMWEETAGSYVPCFAEVHNLSFLFVF